MALTLVARVSGAAEEYFARCRDVVHAIDPRVPIYDVTTLDQRLSLVLARPRFYTTAAFFLAALSVLLAAGGIYGMTSNTIGQRTREMGIRMALGATYPRVRAMLIWENVLPAAIGLIPGAALALASGRFLEHLQESVRPPEVSVCITASGLLLLVGLVSAWAASRSVTRIEPATAVKTD
jgi:ABC-type antimicrobial peptide transport system permease subunit